MKMRAGRIIVDTKRNEIGLGEALSVVGVLKATNARGTTFFLMVGRMAVGSVQVLARAPRPDNVVDLPAHVPWGVGKDRTNGRTYGGVQGRP